MKRAQKDKLADFETLNAVEKMLYGNVEDDPDLEAELLALQNEISDNETEEVDPTSSKSKPNQQRVPHRSSILLDEIAQLSRQISEEVSVKDDENDESVDDDLDLLRELNSVIGEESDEAVLSNMLIHPEPPARHRKSPSDVKSTGEDLLHIITDRIENYNVARKAAQDIGDESKVRRLDRGIKTLTDQLKAVKSGKPICNADIPPMVAAVPKTDQDRAQTSSPTNITPNINNTTPMSEKNCDIQDTVLLERGKETEEETDMKMSCDESTLKFLISRRDEYKKATFAAKQRGDKEATLGYFKICKQLDNFIDACRNGQTIQLNDIPISPLSRSSAEIHISNVQKSIPANQVPTSNVQEPVQNNKVSILEALQQRLEKFKATGAKAQEEGDTSKERRMARINKQYEDAIRAYKANKPVDFSELPSPPGFPPLPGAGTGQPPKALLAPLDDHKIASHVETSISDTNLAIKAVGPTPPKQSRQEQQLSFLLERQKQFKCAALDAKNRGDMAGAKNFLRQAMGFEQMIQASRSGLPVDISKTPIPPQAKTAQTALKPLVKSSLKAASDLALDKAYGARNIEASGLVRENRDTVYNTLENDLIKQIQLCEHNRDYFTKFGDVAKVTLFENLGSICKKELDSLRNGFKHGDPVPRFHYETKKFPMLQCCPDLGYDDFQLCIIRGLLLKLPTSYEPKDADIFVKYDLPFPKDCPQSGKTPSVRGTNSPTFDFDLRVKVNLKSRQFLLLVKRHGIKFEIYQRGSLFRSDKLLGTADIKLLQLENKAEIHESLDVMEGRRPAGGKIEIKIRIREPLLNKSTEEKQEKWLVIDEFLRLPRGLGAKNILPAL